MKKLYVAFLMLILLMFISGCIEKKIDPDTLKSPDEKALYDLMVARCRAVNKKDINLFRQIYTQDSPELKWIEETAIPMWSTNDVDYRVSSIKRISIVGNDAAVTFVLSGFAKGWSWLRDTEVLYVKEKNQWKIESTGDRY